MENDVMMYEKGQFAQLLCKCPEEPFDQWKKSIQLYLDNIENHSGKDVKIEITRKLYTYLLINLDNLMECPRLYDTVINRLSILEEQGWEGSRFYYDMFNDCLEIEL